MRRDEVHNRQVSEQVIEGSSGLQIPKSSSFRGKGAAAIIKDLTYLAGPQYASRTQEGIEKAIATEARK